ncbi:DUF6255 family natural product biosynthesis protein [Streptomyces griseocarneus]|uniref:DUF6255 family natural product biosynthesis protein n=1 Tax=Streptomyces griseocarneus TaxID=51201 RepID=UPI00167D0728|nr:DUF6255 family natural product biosynthesis protein [Streptomyces griseocarneus]MBZ6472203.1 hypothetical protein [Streptomyces griseocarneus]GHG73295.1 hypothetical protein GCM10018779_49350 [Streptomyces griseocarneus]
MTTLQAALAALPTFMVLHLLGCALGTRPVLSAPTRRSAPPKAARLPVFPSGKQQRYEPLQRSEDQTPGGTAAPACPHADVDSDDGSDSSWTTSGGIQTCTRCGTRRVVDYRALALALELPERGPSGAPDGATVAGAGTGAVGRRYDELRRRVREANRRSARGKP